MFGDIMNNYKVAGYLRISKEEKEQTNSIANQKQIINSYIKNKKDFKLVDYYIDDGYSGTNFNRPGFKKLLEDIKNEKVNTIIVKDLSRFARNYIDAGNYIENIFKTQKVRFISINDYFDSMDDSYYIEDILPIKNISYDFSAKDISRKVRSTLKIKQLKGEFIGVTAPYGYLKDPKDKHKFIIDKESAYIVKKIFNMILLGKSRKEIAEHLNNEKVPIPSLYKVTKEKTSSNKWNDEMVDRILKSETYTGTLIQNVKTKPSYRVDKLIDVSKDKWIKIDNHHEVIITKDKFDKVQQILNRKVKVNKNNEIDLFAGYLKCSHCGSSLTIKKSKEKIYYYCSSYIRNKKCIKYSINKKKLEQMVKDEIIKKYNIEVLNRKLVNELIDMIYIIDKNNIKIKFKNV